jgi:hypothetical protein
MLVCLGDEGLNLAAIEDWKWLEATKELSVTFSMNRIKTYKGDAAVALRKALRGNGPLSLTVVHLLPLPLAANGSRLDAAHQGGPGGPASGPVGGSAGPAVGVVEGTLNS